MYTAKHITVDHKDLIHDVSYDFYGKRMATCSSDQSVKVRKDVDLYLTCIYYVKFIVYRYYIRFDFTDWIPG